MSDADEEQRQRDIEAEREALRTAPVVQNYFTPGRAAKYPYGVLYQGEFETPSDGTAQAVRLHARALAETGIPLLLRSFSGVVVNADGVAEPVFAAGLPPEVDEEVGHLLSTDIAVMRPVIKHLVIRSVEHLRQVLMPRGAVPLDADNIEQQIAMRDQIYSNTIVYSVWERDRIDEGIARLLARVRQCWVPCSHNRQLLVKSGVPEDRVHVVPHPYLDSDKIHVCTRRPPLVFDGWRRFYSIGRWEPRKGFAELIEAFLTAFRSSDKVSLSIKYSGTGNWPDYPTPEEALARAVAAAPLENAWTPQLAQEAVRTVGGRVKRSKIVQLHFENNVYVSASHGEAWGLPQFEAKLAGNRMVYVPWGGVIDFASDEDVAVPCELQPAHASYKWEHGARWAGYRMEDLVEGLRRARLPERFERQRGFEGRFGLKAVGEKMRILVDAALPRISTLPPE